MEEVESEYMEIYGEAIQKEASASSRIASPCFSMQVTGGFFYSKYFQDEYCEKLLKRLNINYGSALYLAVKDFLPIDIDRPAP